MHQFHLHPEFTVQMFRQMLSGIYRTVLSTRATEANGKMCKSALHIAFHRSVDQRTSVFEEADNLSVFFEKTDNRLVQTGKRFVAFILAGIVHRATIEHKASAVACGIVRNPLFVSKAHHSYRKLAFL